MPFGDFFAFRKDDGGESAGPGAGVASGPAQSDVHQDRIIGAIHPFVQSIDDPRMCGTCGMTQSQHAASFMKFMQAASEPDDPDMMGGADDPDDPDASLEQTEAEDNDTDSTDRGYDVPPSPMLDGFMSPEDDSEDDDLGLDEHNAWGPGTGGNNPGSASGNIGGPGAIPAPWEPVSLAASLGTPQRAPQGLESGEVGEWQTANPQGNPDTAGESPTGSPRFMAAASSDLPRDPMGNLKQDGPISGPSNPGTDPASQVDNTSSYNAPSSPYGPSPSADPTNPPHMASPADPPPPGNGTIFHHFQQCPQCGVAADPTEATCPNPWCGHDLSNDGSSSFDEWSAENDNSYGPTQAQ